jgi:SAM-dependent methyltransferase
MAQDHRTRFDEGAEAWAAYYRKPLGRIRHAVTWHNLAAHLPAIEGGQEPPRVLDAGGGSGELALELVRAGYRAWLLDPAAAMLDVGRRAARDLPNDVGSRLSFCLSSVDDAPETFAPGFFDAIACHTLIEYVPAPQDTLRTLAGLLRPGGLLSVSFVNRHAVVLRQVWARGDLAGARASLEEGTFHASLFDVPGRSYTVDEAGDWLETLGLAVAARYGVRAFADFAPAGCVDDPEFYDELLNLELEAAARSPYMLIARYVQLISYKSISPGEKP